MQYFLVQCGIIMGLKGSSSHTDVVSTVMQRNAASSGLGGQVEISTCHARPSLLNRALRAGIQASASFSSFSWGEDQGSTCCVSARFVCQSTLIRIGNTLWNFSQPRF